jgi:hypothetical protein
MCHYTCQKRKPKVICSDYTWHHLIWDTLGPKPIFLFFSKKRVEIEAPVELSGPIFPCNIWRYVLNAGSLDWYSASWVLDAYAAILDPRCDMRPLLYTERSWIRSCILRIFCSPFPVADPPLRYRPNFSFGFTSSGGGALQRPVFTTVDRWDHPGKRILWCPVGGVCQESSSWWRRQFR